jgi:hypothetical protein
MTRVDPSLWQLPKWHPDCDGDFQFAGLRAFAKAVLDSTDLDAKLAIIDEGYARVEVFSGTMRIGQVYVNRGNEPEVPDYSIFAGEEDNELHTRKIAVAIRFLNTHRTPHPDDAG